jgi:hypothetical protein
MEEHSTTSSAFDRFEAEHVFPKEGRTLIVGSRLYMEKEDRRMRYGDALGVDMQDGPGVDRVLDLEEPLPDDLGQFAHVECISVLEHSRRPWLMAANIERLLEDGGTLHVVAPFVWRPHGYPGDYYRYTVDGLRALFEGVEFMALMYANSALTPKNKIPKRTAGGYIYMQRTEACGFGVKR